MNRRFFLRTASWTGIVACGVSRGTAGGSHGTNVLFLCVDDLKPELGCYGDKRARTPEIDRLAASGVLFERQYVQQAICAPSRMSTFTGMRPDRTKVWDLKTYLLDVRPDAKTMQQVFRERGYETAGCGKVMHGARDEHPPSWSVPFGFDESLPYDPAWPLPADGEYQDPRIRAVFAEMKKQGVKGWAARKKWMSEHGARPAYECLDVPDDAYSGGAMATWAIARLNRFAKESKPFFLTIGFHRPHLPFVAPKKYWDLFDESKIDLARFRKHAKNSPEYAYHTWGELRNYSGIPKQGDLPEDRQRKLIHAYLASVAYTDAQIGRVLKALRENGLERNTVVVLWGDHGWHLGDHGLWCKHSNFEQATRSPLIIRVPGLSRGGRVSSPVEAIDVYPTLCELCGVPKPEVLEGRSLVPALRDSSVRVKEFAVSQYPRTHVKLMGYAVRTDRYRLVLWMDESVARTGKPDLSRVQAAELYDYEKDPDETVSLAGNPEYAEVRKRLEGMLLSVFKFKEPPNVSPDT